MSTEVKVSDLKLGYRQLVIDWTSVLRTKLQASERALSILNHHTIPPNPWETGYHCVVLAGLEVSK